MYHKGTDYYQESLAITSLEFILHLNAANITVKKNFLYIYSLSTLTLHSVCNFSWGMGLMQRSNLTVLFFVYYCEWQ